MSSSSSSSWLAAYQKAVDTATSQTKTFREYIAEKQASLGSVSSFEEATKQLRDTVSTVTTTVAQTAQRATASATVTATAGSKAKQELLEREMGREMAEYGITDEFVEAVRSKLEYSIFRDYKLPGRVAGGSRGTDDDNRLRLNAWQERHVILLMQRMKEVDALRYALCPKYMDDGVFWAIYFELVRKMLPVEAFEYVEGGAIQLPRRFEEAVEAQGATRNTGGLEYLESRFREMREISERVIGERLRRSDTPSVTNVENDAAPRASEERQGDMGNTASAANGPRDAEDEEDTVLDEYLRHAEEGDETEDGEALDDDELDAYLDTLALSSDDEKDA